MLSGNGRGRVADQAVKSKGGRLLIKFTQRDGYGSSIEFIERRGSDGADVDEKNNVSGLACRNSNGLVEYIGGFAAVQTFVSKTTYLTSAASGMLESKVADVDSDSTGAAAIIQFEAGVEIVVAGIRFIDGAGSPLPAQGADICGKRAKISEIAIIDGRGNQIVGSGSIRSIAAACQHTACLLYTSRCV